MHLTEFIFIQNCLSGIFEEMTGQIDTELRNLEDELASKTNLQLETISTVIDDSAKLTIEQMKEQAVPLFRLRCQL